MYHSKVLFLSFFVLLMGSLNFFIIDKNTFGAYTSITDYKPIFYKNIDALQNEITKLNELATQFEKEPQHIEAIQSQLSTTRKAYKKVEFILEYFYPEHIKEYINGAPFDHVNPNPVADKFKTETYYTATAKEYAERIPLDYRDKDHFRGTNAVVSPVGLQVFDELIFSETPELEKEKVLALTLKLQTDFNTIAVAFKQRKYLEDFEIIEASRLELVRIFVLGITGFDTPGSLNAIPEAEASLSGLEEIMVVFLANSSLETKEKINILFKESRHYLKKHTNFEHLDRLSFLTRYINPLYKNMLIAQKEQHLPSSAEKYGNTPSWNSDSDNVFASNFLNPYYYSLLRRDNDSEALQSLGETIFYDTSLSKSGTMSCASCHKPELAFTDGLPKSAGNVTGTHTLRNSPSLLNSVFSDRFFYDLRTYDLEEQAEHVIENHLEFDTSYAEIIEKMMAKESYVNSFNQTFKTEKGTINRSQFAAALSSYLISLQSFNSAFDQYVTGKTAKLPNEVKRGFNLFMGKANCATCHFVPTFSGLVPPLFRENESEVLGVLKNPKGHEIDPDLGRFENGIDLDHFAIYNHSFKTTTVRNTELTAPYFHNGAYATLDEVLDFYNQGGAAGMGLGYEVPNQTLPPEQLNLSKRELKDLKAFIHSLTDNPFSDKHQK